MIAQSLIEYGAISSSISLVRERLYPLISWLSDLSPTAWVAIAGLVVLVLWGRGRRR
jgi:hypothetical protein